MSGFVYWMSGLVYQGTGVLGRRLGQIPRSRDQVLERPFDRLGIGGQSRDQGCRVGPGDVTDPPAQVRDAGRRFDGVAEDVKVNRGGAN